MKKSVDNKAEELRGEASGRARDAHGLGAQLSVGQAAAVVGAEVVTGEPTVCFSHVTEDSRQVRPGSLFVAVRGSAADGHRFVGEAIARGAVAVMLEDRSLASSLTVPAIVVGGGRSRLALALVSRKLYGCPDASMRVIGVTGTNGKSTVAWALAQLLSATGRRAEFLGTTNQEMTTPSAPLLFERLRRLADQGVQYVVLEVSSHGLDQDRVAGISFDLAVFTNLSEDHLDYHGTMEAYFGAKAKLFEKDRAKQALVNADDRWGRLLARMLRERGAPPVAVVASRRFSGLAQTREGLVMSWRGRRVRLASPSLVFGRNLYLAAKAAELLGLGGREVATALGSVVPPPGRMEVVVGHNSHRGQVVVDYAHSPAALETAISDARTLSSGRVILVFGCGGDRERQKRPLMGKVAARMADLVFVTTDNPRSEDPSVILAEVLSGVDRPEAVVVVEPDREAAIYRAIAASAPGDVVLVAGKGHETYQLIGGSRIPFDDREVARKAFDDLVNRCA